MLAKRVRTNRKRLLSLIPMEISPEAAASMVERLIIPQPFGYGPDRALLYYRQVPDIIEARITLNRAAFVA